MTINPPVTLSEFKVHLTKTLGQAGNDEELTLTLGAATGAAEGIVGPIMIRTIVEDVDSDGGKLYLRRTPGVAITSVVRVGDGFAYNPADLYLDKDAGVIRHLNGCIARGTYTVTYTAGRTSELALVPEDLKAAVMVIGGHLWKTQRGPQPRTRGNVTTGEATGWVPGAGYLIPNQAATLLQQYKPALVG